MPIYYRAARPRRVNQLYYVYMIILECIIDSTWSFIIQSPLKSYIIQSPYVLFRSKHSIFVSFYQSSPFIEYTRFRYRRWWTTTMMIFRLISINWVQLKSERFDTKRVARLAHIAWRSLSSRVSIFLLNLSIRACSMTLHIIAKLHSK